MPAKGKKGVKSPNGKKGKRGNTKTDPMAPDYVPPPPKHGDKLVKLLTTHKVDEKELHGFKVSSRALQQLTPQEIRDLRVVFEAFDTTGKGFIAYPELKKAMKVLGFKMSKEQAKQLVREMGTKHSGWLSFNEFLDVIIEKQGDSRDIYDEILQGFKMFDYDKTGRITYENLQQACVDGGVKLAKQEIDEMMLEADQNGDGYVDKEEFIKIMLQTNLF